MDNDEFKTEHLDALVEEDYLKRIDEKLILWENMAKSELTKLKYNPDLDSEEAGDILIGYTRKDNENEKDQRKAKKLARVKTMYLTLQHISFVRRCISSKNFALAILYALETPIYLMVADYASGMKLRQEGGKRETGTTRPFGDYVLWANEDADLKKRRRRLSKVARAEIIAKNHPKKDGTFLDSSTILKGIKTGKAGIQG